MKKSVFLLLAILASALVHGQDVADFASSIKGGKAVELQAVKMHGLRNIAIYNIDCGGFVVTSNDPRTRTILGYSTQGHVIADSLPDGLRYWLDKYEQQFEQLGNTPLSELKPADKAKSTAVFPDSVAPLITTQWSQQGDGYNSMVPYDTNLYFLGGHPTVGCGALAAAQIMRYWQFPQQGHGQHSYTYSNTEYPCFNYGTVSADFEHTTYHYDLMPNQLSVSSTPAEVEAVATLMAHCGVACNMIYNSDCMGSSGSTITSNRSGLQRFFHYNSDSHVEHMPNHSYSDWVEALKTDLSAQMPVYYCGQSNRDDNLGTVSTAHAFVCDGYGANNMFHFNWGWGGYCDGYYALTILRPTYQYNFSSYEYCMFNLHPAHGPQPVLAMADDLRITQPSYTVGDPISGQYAITNVGDTLLDIYVGVNIYGAHDSEYYGCVDGRHIVLAPGDTAFCPFTYNLELNPNEYTALMQYSTDSFYAGIPYDQTQYFDDLDHIYQANFSIESKRVHHYTNLVLFLRFADDPDEFCHPSHLENIFSTQTPNVTDYFEQISYGQIHFHTVYSNQFLGNVIIPYTDIHPRGYYQPYSPSNPEGYTVPNPLISISQREAELIDRLCRHIDSLHLVPAEVNLDGNGDGDIDNISIIVQGNTGEWAELLWPHMEYFPHDSVGHTLTINGKRVNAFNFEFEGSVPYFTTRTFCHEMGHSIGLPDLYHYLNFTDVCPVYYDNMASYFCHPSVIYKHKVLNLTEKPIQITQDGTYTINANSLSAENNLYYIKSAIDPNQWFTIEYRVPCGAYERLPRCGLIMGRWMDTVPIDIQRCGNAYYDFVNTPNTYYVFRPNSTNDNEQGDFTNPFFSMETGATSFGPSTNPHPFLADGTPEQSFLIYGIQDMGETCTFSVRFLSQGISETEAETFALYPNPATTSFQLTGVTVGSPISIYNTLGQCVATFTYTGAPVSLPTLSPALYFVKTEKGTKKLMIE